MKLQKTYIVASDNVVREWKTGLAICVATSKDKAEMVAEALNICAEYYDKPCPPVRTISQF